MSYTCLSTTCAIALSKATFPVAMNCPVCQQPLQEVLETSSISESDEQLIATLPYVIAYPLKRALAEKHAWTRVNLLKDTFLNYLKYLGLISASEFFNSPLKDKKMVALFQQALAEPSFGSWNQYIRETLKFLNEKQHHFFCSDLPKYYEAVETGNKRKLYKGEIEYIDSNGDVQLKKQEATAIGMLINFRNRYLGHGLTLDETAAQQLWDEYFPIFRTLLEQMQFAANYPMFKHEHGETYRLQSSELTVCEKGTQSPARVWMENPQGESMDILPFFVVPGEVSLGKDDKEQILAYESYTGKTIKFFSPEGTEKQTSGKILEKLNLLLRDKQKEHTYTPEEFTKEIFLARVADENKLILDTLVAEKKVIPGVYVHREEMEIKLREWIGARANIFVMAAEAGSGKTNLLVEMQKQYTERDFPTLLIRAGRMEKTTIHAQLCYLLNIDEHESLAQYPAIAGTQEAPTFVLIDGLNEAHDAEKLWIELVEISKHFAPGSLKFVVTSRANTAADINRYGVNEEQESYLYGDNKEREKQVSAYTHWLTALSMEEMKQAWEYYVQKDKGKFKPQFGFDDLATFDRSLYSHISNPLVLRLFLETYQGKKLPNKGNQHLDVWSDWLSTFSKQEQDFFKDLADAIWDKGENELLLDDVLNNENLKSYFTTDQLNAPYPRLRNMGWTSRYVKDLNTCIGFTVEGALLHLLGKKLQSQPSIDITEIKQLLQTGSQIQRAGVVAYLQQLALKGDLNIVCELIDAEGELHFACNNAMLTFLKSYGIELLINKVFSEPTDKDWLAILMLNETLNELQEHVLRKKLLSHVTKFLTSTSKSQILIALKAIDLLDYDDAKSLYQNVRYNPEITYDSELLYEFAICENKFNNIQFSLDILIKSISDISFLQLNPKQVFNHFYTISKTYCDIGNAEKAYEYLKFIFEQNAYQWTELDYAYAYNLKGYIGTSIDGFSKNKKNIADILHNYNLALEIRLKILGAHHPDTVLSYNNIAYLYLTMGENDIALKYFLECLNINLKLLYPNHPNMATAYNNLGVTYTRLKKFNLANEYLAKVLEIEENRLGKEHHELALFYNNLAIGLSNALNFKGALINFEKCLNIELKYRDTAHPITATMYFNIGNCYKELKQYKIAIEKYNKLIDFINSRETALRYMNSKSFREYVDFRGSFHFSMAESHEGIGDIQNSLEFYIKSAEIRKDDPDLGIEVESTQESIKACIRLAKELGKESELPEWMKEIKN